MISLIDINDNAPVFQSTPYAVTDNLYAGYILENASISTEILYVYATDEDSGSLGKVTYSFIAPSSKRKSRVAFTEVVVKQLRMLCFTLISCDLIIQAHFSSTRHQE